MVVFQTGPKETSPSSFPTLSFTFHQVAADRQKYTFLSHCCLLRACSEEHPDSGHQRRLCGTHRSEVWDILLKDTAKRKPTQPAPLPGHQVLTQIKSCTNTTFPFLHAKWRAVRPSPSPQVSFTSSRVPWARSRMTVRKSSSAVALRRCWPRESSRHCSGARKSFCSYFARIQRSFSSLEKPKETGHSNLASLPLNGGSSATSRLANSG